MSGVLTVAVLAGCAGDGDDVPTETSTTSDEDRTRTGTPTPTETPAPTRTITPVERRDVTFETDTGVALVGTTYGDGPCGVVLVPQRNETRAAWEPQARLLAERGYLAFAIETASTPDPAASVDGAVTHLREGYDVERVVLVGAGTGGEAVVGVASRRRDVDGVVTLSATGGAAHAANLSGRTLFVASEGDPARTAETARALGGNATATTDNATTTTDNATTTTDNATTTTDNATTTTDVVVYEGSAHGRALFTSDHRADLRDRLLAVLQDSCAA